MYRFPASTLLVLILTLLVTGISEAGLWVCIQPDGSSLYTDQPVGKGACKKHEPVTELVYMPPIIRENLPPPGTITDNKQAADEPVARPDSSEDSESAPSEASDYNSQSGDLGDYADEYPVYGDIYNYIPGVYGVPSGRHKGFPNERRRYNFRHNIPFQPDMPIQPDGAAPAPSADSRHSPSQPVVPAAPRSFPGFTQEIQHR